VEEETMICRAQTGKSLAKSDKAQWLETFDAYSRLAVMSMQRSKHLETSHLPTLFTSSIRPINSRERRTLKD
jgi:hypothetical protein